MVDILADITHLQKLFDIFKNRLSNIYEFDGKIFQLDQKDKQTYIDDVSNIMNIAIFLKRQVRVGEIVPLDVNAHYHTTDIHGDLLALGFVLLKSGVAKFVEGESPINFFNKKNCKIIKSIELFNEDITIDLVPILNLEVNSKFKGSFTFGGDMADKGRYSDSCYQTYMRLIYNKNRKEIDFIIGNHETPALEIRKEDVVLYNGKWKNLLLNKMNPYLYISDLRLQQRNLIMFHEDVRKNVDCGNIVLCLSIADNTLISHAVFVRQNIENLVKKIAHIIYTNIENWQKSQIIEKMINIIKIFQTNGIIKRIDGTSNFPTVLEMKDFMKYYRVGTALNAKNIENAMNEYIKIFHDIAKNFDNFLIDEPDFPRVKTVISGTLKYLIDEKTNSVIPVEDRNFNPAVDMLAEKVIAGHEETPRYNDKQSNDIICLMSSNGHREFLYTDVRQSSGYAESEDISNPTFIYSKNIGKLNSYKQISIQIPISTIPKYIESTSKFVDLYGNTNIIEKIVEKGSRQLLIP